MSYKTNIGVDLRVFYTLIGGDDNEDGNSLETAKATIQGSIDAVNALTIPPSANDPAAIVISGSGLFNENITLTDFTRFDGTGLINRPPTGNVFTLSSTFAGVFGVCEAVDDSTIAFDVSSQNDVSIECVLARATGISTRAVSYSGTSEGALIRIGQVELVGQSSVGIDYTAGAGEPESFLIPSTVLSGNSTTAFVFNPSDSSARAVFDAGSITESGTPTPTTGITVVDGHLSCFINEIIADAALDVQGGELSIMANCITGDITVDVGASLICEIAEFTGSLTNNGTIQGRIGTQYFGTGFVVGPGPTVENTAIAVFSGTGGETITNIDNIKGSDNGTNTIFDIEASNATTGTARFTLSDFNGATKGEFEYLESTDTTELLSTVDLTIGIGPGSGTIDFLGNDIDLRYDSGGTNNSFTIDLGSNPDTNAPFVIETGGSNSTDISFFVGSRNPNTNVTGVGGDFYIRGDGISSQIYQNRTLGSTTWQQMGNVSNASPVINNSLAVWDGTTGTLLKDNADLRSINTGSVSGLQIESPSATGSAFFEFLDSSSITTVIFSYSENNDETLIFDSSGNGLDIQTQFGPIDFILNDSSSGFSINATSAPDTTTVFQITTGGTNAGTFPLFVGNRNPSGNVTSFGGAMYVRENGFVSDFYFKRSAGNDTSSWFGLFENFVQGPASSTSASIPTWDGTGGDLLDNNPTARIGITSTSTVIDLDTVTSAGQSGVNFRNESGTLRSAITNDVNIDEFAINSFFGPLLISSEGNTEIATTTATGKLLIDGNSVPDTNELITLDSGGSNGAVTDWHVGSRDPNGNITNDGGSFYFRSDGISSGQFIRRAAPSGSDLWYSVSVDAPQVFEIFTAADLDALATAGVITITTPTTFKILGSFSSATRVVITDSELSVNGDFQSASDWIYTGTGTLFSGTGTFHHTWASIIGNASATYIDIDGPTGGELIEIFAAAIIGFGTFGTFTNGLAFLVRQTSLIGGTAGFTLANTGVSIATVALFNGPSATFFNYSGFQSARNVEIDNFAGDTSGALIRIDPSVNNGTRLSFSGSNIISPDYFDISGGSTGTFTAVADAAVAATTINSVTDSSGVARFNFTVGPTLFVDQEVINSTFVTNTAYNGTFIITTVGVGFFEVSSIAFGTDETGSFLSNSVTFTDTTTTLSDGDTLVIDGTFNTDYDGGGTVYNQLTNSFQLNRTFTVTQIGDWDTAGIDQTDPRVLATGLSNFDNSRYIATAFVNNNTTAEGTIVNNTFRDITFGTVGTALVPGTTIERWKLIDEVNGTFEYTGNEPFDGYITYDFNSESTGGSVDFRFKWVHDVGAGFVNLPDDVEAVSTISGNSRSISKTFPLEAVKGDQIKPQLTRNSGTSGLTTQYATVYATQ